MASHQHLVGVRGHTAAQAGLVRALERGQLHHGMILVGPRGVGKARFAKSLAAAIHCPHAPGGCGRCNVCERVEHETHVGVEWIRPDAEGGTIKVATARELATRLELAPFEGEHHVVIFDPATALTEQAYNALLKAIEEPRPGVHFLMLTTALDALIPTILSRCLAVRLGRLDDEDVRALLADQLAQSPSEVPPERIELAIRLAWGSAALAIELALDDTLDGALTLLGHLIGAADGGPEAIFGGDKSALWTAWTEAIGPAKTGRPARERALARRVAELWLLHLRECLRHQPGLPNIPTPRLSIPALLRHLDRVQQFAEGLDRNPNVRLSLESTLLELGDASC